MGYRLNPGGVAAGDLGADAHCRMLRAQRGIVLFIALVALVVLSLGVIALVRSVDTSGTIAGNLAFKQASTQATHIGIGRALETLRLTVNRDQSNPQVGYFSHIANLASVSDVPDRTAWTAVPCIDATGSMQTAIRCDDSALYRMQTIIERLCVLTPVSDPVTQCISAPPGEDGSKKSGSLKLVSYGQIHYRVTVRVRGPRNAISVAQAMVAY